jgi:hypothetical protein
MIKYFAIVFTLFIIPINLIPQGFDWQWSARIPFENPQNYYGINANYGLDYSIGTISFKEDNISAPDFIDLNGNNFALGINYTHWNKYNKFAIYSIFQYNNLKLHSYSIDNVPLNDNIIAKYKIALDYNINSINLIAGVNYRILESHLLIGTGIQIGTIINNNFEVNEEILGPPEVPPFKTNPPSYKRKINTGKINELNNFFLKSHIKISYNLEIKNGTYIEPNICFAMPLGSMFEGEKVKHYSILFAINYYTSLF